MQALGYRGSKDSMYFLSSPKAVAPQTPPFPYLFCGCGGGGDVGFGSPSNGPVEGNSKAREN